MGKQCKHSREKNKKKTMVSFSTTVTRISDSFSNLKLISRAGIGRMTQLWLVLMELRCPRRLFYFFFFFLLVRPSSWEDATLGTAREAPTRCCIWQHFNSWYILFCFSIACWIWFPSKAHEFVDATLLSSVSVRDRRLYCDSVSARVRGRWHPVLNADRCSEI